MDNRLVLILIFISNDILRVDVRHGFSSDMLYIIFTQEHDRHHRPMHHNSHKSGPRSIQIDHHKNLNRKVYIQPNLLFIDCYKCYTKQVLQSIKSV